MHAFGMAYYWDAVFGLDTLECERNQVPSSSLKLGRCAIIEASAVQVAALECGISARTPGPS
jgi:hypothetical protein